MLRKLKILLTATYGELIKLYYSLHIHPIKYGLNTLENRSEKIIISLTSYGRRVSSILPFTIISLLKQTCKPDEIILWLDSDNWNEKKIPIRLKKLKKYGLSIRYCKNIRSYKKLIPALEAYPNDIIITCDDDLFYRKDMIKQLIDEYRKDTTCIYAHRAHKVGILNSEKILPYNNWEEEISGVKGALVFPTSGGGCLYKKSLLYQDIDKESLFMSLSPSADDVWFYFMALLQKTDCVVLPHRQSIFIPIDVFYQSLHNNSNLSSINCGNFQNDLQINAVMDYYNIKAANILTYPSKVVD